MDRPHREPVSGHSVGDYHRGLALPLKILCDRTLKFLGLRIERVFDQVNESFFDLADGSADAGLQTAYFDAIKSLRADKTVIIDQWLAGVASAFDNLVPMAGSGGDHSEWLESGSSLGDDDLEEVVVFDQIVSAANESNRSELLVLQQCISKISNRRVSLQQLPLGPELITEQFVGVLRSNKLAIQPKLTLLELYNRVVLGQLPELLSQSNQLLEDLGIVPGLAPEIARSAVAGCQTVGAVAEESARSALPAGRRNADTDNADTNNADTNNADTNNVRCTSRVISRRLIPRFSGGGRHLNRQFRSAGGDLTGINSVECDGLRSGKRSKISHEDLLELLQHLPLIVDCVDGQDEGGCDADFSSRQRRAGIGIRHQVDLALSEREQCFTDLSDRDQVIITLLDRWFQLIRKRFNGKGRVARQLRALLLPVELPVCRAALVDPSFFDFAQHPFRRLLNEIFTLGYCLRGVEDLAKDPLYKKLEELLKRVLYAQKDAEKAAKKETEQHTGLDSVLCGDLLSELIGFIGVDQRRVRSIDKGLVEQARAEHKINIARCGVDELLNSRLAGKEFGYALVEFVEKAWASVLFRASLKYGGESEQWVRAVHLLDQLLGLEPDDEIDRQFLDRLVAVLSNSLAGISFESYEVQHMLGNICRYLLEDKNKPENMQPVLFDKAEARQMGDYSLRVRVESVDPDIPGETNSAENDLIGFVDDNLLMQVDSLKPGMWVELEDDKAGESLPCRLIGIVGSAGKYLFGDRNGRQIAAISRNRLALKLKTGKLTVLDINRFDDLLVVAIRDSRPVA